MKKLVRYLSVSKGAEHKFVLYFVDFKGKAVVVNNSVEATFSSLALLKKNVDAWLEEHDRLPKPTTTVDMTNYDQCLWVPVMVDEDKIPEDEPEKSAEDGTDEKIFTLEEIEKDLGLGLN